jgi:hypothetical protein
MDTVTHDMNLAGRMYRLRAFPTTGAISGVPMMVVAYRIANAPMRGNYFRSSRAS